MLAWLKKFPFRTALVFLAIVSTNNIVYYNHTKSILIENQKAQMGNLFNTISTAIDNSAEGEKIIEELIGKNLRTAAIAAQNKLPPDVDQVSVQELVELSRLLGIDHITLFKKTPDDIIGAQSSDPKEVGASSKNWGYFYLAFHQLFELQEVDVGIGQTLPHYWSGPLDTSTTNQSNVDKWGYYYDGTANYMIDPFIHDTDFRDYQKKTGVDKAIDTIVSSNQDLGLEVAVINSDKLLGIKHPEVSGDNWFSERMVLFGAYRNRDPDEAYYAQQALLSKEPVFYTTASSGRTVLKSFASLDIDYLKYNKARKPLLIEISTDYSKLQSTLNQQLYQMIFMISLTTVLSIAILIAFMAIIRRNQEQVANSVQEAYIGNIDTLFQKVKEQRHDFNNHIATIQALAIMGSLSDLREYTSAIVGENKIINDVINIGIPAIGGLIQAKLAEADSQSIKFEHEFMDMSHLKLNAVKASDLVKIVSNLIDNAFDATKLLDDPDGRKVCVRGQVHGNQILFTVMNTGFPIPPEKQHQLFESGYSTKPADTHSGLGLHIVKKLIVAYKGSIHLENLDDGVEFTVMIPVGS